MTSLPVPTDFKPRKSLDEYDIDTEMSPDAIFYNAIYECYKSNKKIRDKELFFRDILNSAYTTVFIVGSYKRPCLHYDEFIYDIDEYDLSTFREHDEFCAAQRKVVILSIVYQLLREAENNHRGIKRLNERIRTDIEQLEGWYGFSFFAGLCEQYNLYLKMKEGTPPVDVVSSADNSLIGASSDYERENAKLKLEVEALRAKEESLQFHFIEYNKVISSLTQENDRLKERCAKSPFTISRGKQTSVLVALETMYAAKWISKADGSEYTSRDEMINDLMKVLFNQEEVKDVKQKLNSARRRTYDGLKKYFDDLLKHIPVDKQDIQ